MSTQIKQFSCEIFPPKTSDGKIKLAQTCDELNKLKPEFFSVTYGAGGSTRDTTKGVVVDMIQRGIDTAPHLSFGGDDETSICELLQQYKDAGVKRLVALRGDLPSGMGRMQLVHANELVAFVRKHFGDTFHIEVAAYPEIHPEGKNYESDVHFLKAKFDAGANSAITQYFYNLDAYLYFMDECQRQGITQPIFPGIMPITNFRNLARFSQNCGADIPRWLTKRMESFGEDSEAVRAFGAEFVTRLCEQLLANGAPGLHFYTMNQVEPVRSIWQNLGIEK